MIGARFARLSTGMKMLLILSAALLPLGLVAIWASVHNAQQKSNERRDEMLARLEIKAQRLNAAFSRASLTISTASSAVGIAPNAAPSPPATACTARGRTCAAPAKA